MRRPLALTLGPIALLALLATACGPLDEAELARLESELRLCAPGATTKGVDVSYYQGTVSWSQVKQAGIAFAIARVSDGTSVVDTKFASNWSGIKAAGLIRGVYQYFRPKTSATAQAQLLLSKIGTLGAGDLPPVIDVESSDGASDATVIAGVKTWLSVVEAATGRKPIIYTSSGYWSYLAGNTGFGGYPLWVANYGATCPLMPTGWSAWKLWQYSDQGSIKGIPSGVDLNFFNGDLAALQAFAGAGKPAPLALSWKRTSGVTYSFSTTSAPSDVAAVRYFVDGYQILAVTRTSSSTFAGSYTFKSLGTARELEARGYSASGALITTGVGSIDVPSSGAGVFIRQQGAALYEIGVENATPGVAAIEVLADGIKLTDQVSGKTRSTRLAVLSKFSQLGARTFTVRSYNASGSQRGTFTRTFTLR